MARPTCFRLFWQFIRAADSRTLETEQTPSPPAVRTRRKTSTAWTVRLMGAPRQGAGAHTTRAGTTGKGRILPVGAWWDGPGEVRGADGSPCSYCLRPADEGLQPALALT